MGGKGSSALSGVPKYQGPPLTQQPKQPKQKCGSVVKRPRYAGRAKVPFDPEWIVKVAETRRDEKLAAALRQCTSGWWETGAQQYFHFVDPGTEEWKFAGNKDLEGKEFVILDVLCADNGEHIV